MPAVCGHVGVIGTGEEQVVDDREGALEQEGAVAAMRHERTWGSFQKLSVHVPQTPAQRTARF